MTSQPDGLSDGLSGEIPRAGSVKFRHEAETLPSPPGRFGEEERTLNSAWRRVQIIHTPIRKIEQEDHRDLVDTLRELERLFLDSGNLETYYAECMAPEPATNRDRIAYATRAPIQGQAELEHVVMLQAQLMEDAFVVLHLDRYANARDNRGWMNLFRRWGRSPTFNAIFRRIETTFAADFVQFYRLYVHDYAETIDERPIPHPWDAEEARERKRLSSSAGAVARPAKETPAATGGPPPKKGAPPAPPRLLPGVYLDSGIREASSPRLRPPRVEPELGRAIASGAEDAKGDVDVGYETSSASDAGGGAGPGSAGGEPSGSQGGATS